MYVQLAAAIQLACVSRRAKILGMEAQEEIGRENKSPTSAENETETPGVTFIWVATIAS